MNQVPLTEDKLHHVGTLVRCYHQTNNLQQEVSFSPLLEKHQPAASATSIAPKAKNVINFKH